MKIIYHRTQTSMASGQWPHVYTSARYGISIRLKSIEPANTSI